jgi:hypothetical protein
MRTPIRLPIIKEYVFSWERVIILKVSFCINEKLFKAAVE